MDAKVYGCLVVVARRKMTLPRENHAYNLYVY